MGNNGNLIPVQSKEEARERGRRGGIRSGEVRRAKKTMRDTAKWLMKMSVPSDNAQKNLERLGIPKTDRNFQTAMVVRLIQKAVSEGETSAIRLLGELTGDLSYNGYFNVQEEIKTIEMIRPAINIPANGRDVDTRLQIAPQPGPQMMFMTSPADIIIFGGGAGGGKTCALLMEGIRHKDVKGYGAVIFRKNYTQITAEGGLWDASHKIYNQIEGAEPKKTPRYNWVFNGKGKVSFAHIDGDDDLSAWQGSEITYIGFDELTHFTRHQFLYMLSRNRSTCGIKPYIRATCNPDADSWVAEFISWWIDQDTGFPIPERSGRIRYMYTYDNTIYFGDTRKELVERFNCNENDPKSVTFIPSTLKDNPILMKIDPGYLSNLKALPKVDRERLLNGNWKIKPVAGDYFKRVQVEVITELPKDIIYTCRAWDLAATSKQENDNADFTSGVLMGKRRNGQYIIIDVINKQLKASEVERLIKNTSISDRQTYGASYCIRIPQDPGQAGKVLAEQYVKMLAGFNIKTLPVSGSKVVRATPCASQWQAGNIYVLSGVWNSDYFYQMESFPADKHDDMVDATSDAFNALSLNQFNIDSLL